VLEENAEGKQVQITGTSNSAARMIPGRAAPMCSSQTVKVDS
jgi:hypothetical protein